MELNVVMPQKLNVKTICVLAKVRDAGSYVLKDIAGNEVACRDDYVPSFFPGEHYGDYLDLEIDLETGQILNWKKPDAGDVADAFNLSGRSD